ncbi:MAG: hypothetical protein QNJ71_10705 [Acidimicrobiia bacterium]|nr:hypothetical protein [Acidimicrobiia bacterium]
MIEYVIVFVLAMLAGLWATAAGVFMDLDPWAVFVVATAGSSAFTAAVLFFGGRWRDAMIRKYMPDMDERVEKSQLGTVLDTYGVPGLAVASIIFGPSLTLAGVLGLGIDRKRFFLWYAPITVVGYALATAFWVAVS